MMTTVSRSASSRAVRILLPREHGAYGQLLFPMGTALAMGRGDAAALAIAVACAAAFVGHEAVLVLAGQRGARFTRERRFDAILSLAGCAAIAGSTAAWALWHMAQASRMALLLPVALALALTALIWLGHEHTASGEALAAVALSSCGVPIARAGGVSLDRALTAWLVFALSFVVATVAVRYTIARVKQPGRPASGVRGPKSLAAAIIALSFVFATRGWISFAAPLALLPVCGLAAGLSFFPPHPRHLRAVGWSLVSATAVTAILLAIAE